MIYDSGFMIGKERAGGRGAAPKPGRRPAGARGSAQSYIINRKS
jgi:hypothetical protein